MTEEPVLIVPYRDGPYLIRGPVSLRDQTGADIEAGRRVVALCRCGKSRLRPFCDGSHHLINFRAPSEREDRTVAVATREVGAKGDAGAGRAVGAKGDPGAGSGPDASEPDLRALEGDLRRLRGRLVALSASAAGSQARPRVADAARLLAAASAALRGGDDAEIVDGDA